MIGFQRAVNPLVEIGSVVGAYVVAHAFRQHIDRNLPGKMLGDFLTGTTKYYSYKENRIAGEGNGG